MKKIILLAIIALATSVSAYAETSPTCKQCGPGGMAKAYNYTTSKFEALPQCFPWVFASEYFVMNLADMYENQKVCRAKRAIDFRF